MTKENSRNIFNSLQSARNDIKIERNDSEIKSLTSRMFIMETVMKATLSLLKKQGVTNEDLNNEIQAIMAQRKENYNVAPKHYCPKCNKVMQLSNTNPFVANCMYCGTNKPILPFGLGDEDNASEPAQNDAQPAETNANSDSINDPFSDLL